MLRKDSNYFTCVLLDDKINILVTHANNVRR